MNGSVLENSENVFETRRSIIRQPSLVLGATLLGRTESFGFVFKYEGNERKGRHPKNNITRHFYFTTVPLATKKKRPRDVNIAGYL